MPLSDNLIGAWELNEASGNAIDSHGTSDLTDTNTVGAGTGLVYANARDFVRANSEYFTIADNDDLSSLDIDITVEAWVKFDDLTNYPIIAHKGWNSSAEWILYYRSDTSKIRFSWVSDIYTVEDSTTISTGTWYHIMAWHDATNDLIGITVNDDTPTTLGTSGNSPPATPGDFQIGGLSVSSLYHDGLLGPVRFWKRVVSSSEITELYNSGSGRTYAYITGGGGGLSIPIAMRHYLRQMGAG